jgi:predicted CXXCH cytochrome family protein
MRNVMKALLVAALAIPVAASAQITPSKHNFSASSGTNAAAKATTENEICIFCHAPHRALQQDAIWSHVATAKTTGWVGANVTQAGTLLPTTVTSGSARCEACHDGSVAVGSVSNAGNGVAGVITMGGADIAAGTGVLQNAAFIVGGDLGANGSANHPVSIPYAGATYNGITSKALADGALGNYYTVLIAGCTNATGACTSNGANGKIINLYGNAGAAATTTNVGIECGSCHEAHNRYALPNLLRVTNTSSALCLACHNK